MFGFVADVTGVTDVFNSVANIYNTGGSFGDYITVGLAIGGGALAAKLYKLYRGRRAANQRILRDGEGATQAELAASRGPGGGSRVGQSRRRQELIDEANTNSGGVYQCWRCGHTSTNPANMHVGHRNVPTSRGGNLSRPNTCLEGAACNLSSGNRGGPSPGMSCAERGSCGAPYGR